MVKLVAVQVFVLRIVSPAGIQLLDIDSAPNDHFAAGPDGRVFQSAIGRVGGAGSCSNYPCWDCIFRRVFGRPPCGSTSAPDNHLTAGPDGRVTGIGADGAFSRAGGCPTIGAGLYLSPVFKAPGGAVLVSPPQTIISLPVHTAV